MSKTIVLSLAILLFISSVHSQDLDPVGVRITLDQAFGYRNDESSLRLNESL
jgi:type IV secretory pathway TrbF-like protein